MRALALLFFISLPAEAGYFAAAGKTDITPDPSVESVYLAGYGAWSFPTGLPRRLSSRWI
ncbi:MAG: hypothetical protein CO113_01405 [Elusimicrobia bacterium CG_4_9_14_3_um_filter_62_55]|nr:MAG: hypothetical protein CO113_01405 [Elusimicrobia bacterium CG_4_9_14_3_um_filter_62_55]